MVKNNIFINAIVIIILFPVTLRAEAVKRIYTNPGTFSNISRMPDTGKAIGIEIILGLGGDVLIERLDATKSDIFKGNIIAKDSGYENYLGISIQQGEIDKIIFEGSFSDDGFILFGHFTDGGKTKEDVKLPRLRGTSCYWENKKNDMVAINYPITGVFSNRRESNVETFRIMDIGSRSKPDYKVIYTYTQEMNFGEMLIADAKIKNSDITFEIKERIDGEVNKPEYRITKFEGQISKDGLSYKRRFINAGMEDKNVLVAKRIISP